MKKYFIWVVFVLVVIILGGINMASAQAPPILNNIIQFAGELIQSSIFLS